MYRIWNTKDLIEFENYSQLLNYLSYFNYFNGTEFSNSLLDKVGNNPNDVRLSYFQYPYCLVSASGYEIRECRQERAYRIYNDDWNSIYDSLLIRDVRNWKYREDIANQHRKFVNKNKKPSKWRRKYARFYQDPPEFRRGPWPNIHNRCRYGVYRLPRIFNEKKNTAYKEMEPFNRGSRGKNLPDPWDEEPVRDWRNDGWKQQGKRRHQWENGVICREKHQYGKGIYVYKDRSKDLLDDSVD